MKRTIDKFKDFLKKKKNPEPEPKVDHRKEFENLLVVIDKYFGDFVIFER